MRIKKWIMKQQWRIVQIRGIWGLFYGILLLAANYFIYIPLFYDMQTLGPFAFAGVILIVFLVLGYIYDRVLVMWAPSQEVNTERNPYQYVPSPEDRIFWFPLYSTLLDVCEDIAGKYEIDVEPILDTKKYYHELKGLKALRSEDIARARQLRDEFLSKHDISNL